jgi:hypothetical protein
MSRQAVPRLPAPVHAATGLLDELKVRRVPFVIIGSCALAVGAPGLLARRPRDVDLLLPPMRSALDGFVAAGHARGGRVLSWEDDVTSPLFDFAGGEHDLGVLAGRWYLRARWRRCVVDATYECPWLPFEQACAGATWAFGLPFVSPADQLILNRARGWASDLALLERAAQQGLRPGRAAAPYSGGDAASLA